MLTITNLNKSFGGQSLFDNISFNINPGEKIGLTGRNGHGKTTLFRMIINEEHPDSGEISIPKNYKIGYVNQITLQEGWNHVGYPSLITRNPPFDLPVDVDMVMWYNASSGIWERWDFGSESPDNLIEVRPGQGLLIHYTGAPTAWYLEYVN